MNNTKIEWCDSTWNPVTGCLHGCEYCYARKIAQRFSSDMLYDVKNQFVQIGDNFEVAEAMHYVTNKSGAVKVAPYPFGFAPTFHKYRLDDPQKLVTPRTIFVCSMADLFGKWVPDEWIEEVFRACEKAPQHRYLFLTKNPIRYPQLAYKGKLPNNPNMWYGSTLEKVNGCTFSGFDEYKTFISIEPLLEDVAQSFYPPPFTHWVIIGAETGNRKGKAVPQKQWVDNIIERYDRTFIPIFMKDSLIPVVSEENMRREFPWRKKV